MEYTEEVLDRRTGELKAVSLGDWITVTELGQRYRVDRRKVRSVLRELDFVYAPGGGQKASHRVASWALDRGFARHHYRSKTVKHAFDVISPAGQQWIAERWNDALQRVDDRHQSDMVVEAAAALSRFKEETGRTAMTAQQEICWLADHFDGLSQPEIASILNVTQQLVSRFLNIRKKQRADWLATKTALLPDRGPSASAFGFEAT